MNSSVESVGQELLQTLRANSKTAKTSGIVLMIAGFLSLVAPFAAGASIVIMTGVLLLVGGVSQLLFAFKAGTFGQGLMVFLLGLFTALCGSYMISNTGVALGALTLFLAAWFVATGVVEIVWALKMRPLAGWGTVMFGAVISLLLGLMIWRQFPVSGAWAIGVLVGVKMLIGGWWLFSIGKSVETVTTPDRPWESADVTMGERE